MDGYALDKIRQELAPVDRLWRNVQSVTTFQGAGLVSFNAYGDTSWWCLDCCLCLRLPISISRVTQLTLIAKEIPWRNEGSAHKDKRSVCNLLIVSSYCCCFCQVLAGIQVWLWRDFIDVTLVCDDGSIQAHKVLSWPLPQHSRNERQMVAERILNASSSSGHKNCEWGKVLQEWHHINQ